MSTESHSPQEPRAEDAVPGRSVIVVAVVSLVILVVSLVVVVLLLRPSNPRLEARPAPSTAPSTIGTVEQTLVLATARGWRMREAQRHDLETWGWVDRDAGVARIPIERAMDVVAETAQDGGLR